MLRALRRLDSTFWTAMGFLVAMVFLSIAEVHALEGGRGTDSSSTSSFQPPLVQYPPFSVLLWRERPGRVVEVGDIKPSWVNTGDISTVATRAVAHFATPEAVAESSHVAGLSFGDEGEIAAFEVWIDGVVGYTTEVDAERLREVMPCPHAGHPDCSPH